MKTALNSLIVSSVFLLSFLSAPNVFAADTQSLSEVRLVEDKFRNLDAKEAADDLKRSDLLHEAANSVSKLTSTPEKPLDALQIKEVVELLKVSDKFDIYHVIVEQNYTLIKTNEKEIKEELKKLPPKQAKSISDTIDIVLSDGSDMDAPEAKPNQKVKAGSKAKASSKK